MYVNAPGEEVLSYSFICVYRHQIVFEHQLLSQLGSVSAFRGHKPVGERGAGICLSFKEHHSLAEETKKQGRVPVSGEKSRSLTGYCPWTW